MEGYNLLLVVIVILIVIAVFYWNKNKKKAEERPIKNDEKKIDTKKFNSCVVLFLDLYNELTERVKSSINSEDRFSYDEMMFIINKTETEDVEGIKNTLKQFHLQGKFDDVIDDYLMADSDIEVITHRIIEIAKESSSIPNHLLLKLESQEVYVNSFLQSEIDTKIRTELFSINSVKQVELILLELISISKTKLESIALSKMV